MVLAGEAAHGHPYASVDLHLPDYVPNLLPSSSIIGRFAAAALSIFALVWFISGRLKLSKIDRLLMCWWTFTGLVHVVVEGYFTFTPDFYKDKTGFIIAEIWKEYSKADSRYIARDTTVVCVEAITALLDGPLSLLSAYSIATKKPYSHILQLVTSLGLIHGSSVNLLPVIVYGHKFATNRVYYYGYFVILNCLWVGVSLLIFIHCWRIICTSFESRISSKTKDG